MAAERHDYREKIVEALTVLQKKERQEGNAFKARAYSKVIQQIQALKEPVRNMEDLSNAGVSGIGDKIKAKLEEIFATGALKAADDIQHDPRTQMKEALMKVYGIGPAKVKALLDEHPVASMDEFRGLVERKPDILNEKQKIGLKHYDDLLERIPRTEMQRHETRLKDTLREVAPQFHADIVGSYRRGLANSGDIDLLIGFPEDVGEAEAQRRFKEFVERLTTTHGYITDVLAKGAKKFMGVCKLSDRSKARRLDILLTTPAEYPYALLYFTGSEKYNIAVRKRALEKGYTMNEHGMKPVEGEKGVAGVAPVPQTFKEEADILDFLGLPYIPPEDRK